MNRYCWPKLHGKVKPRTVPELAFSRGPEGGATLKKVVNEKSWDNRWIQIPIANIKAPDYIIGFEEIGFR